VTKQLPLVIAILVSVGLALYQLDPAWRDATRLAPGNWNHPDCLSNHWLLIWVAEQLSRGQPIHHNPLYYWPVGDMPVLAGNGSEGFLYMPFHLLLGWPMGVSFYALMVLSLNGLSGYALARAAGAERWASLVTIGVTGIAPYTIQELSSGRFNQVSIFWMLFTLASWLALLNRPGLRRAVGTGLLWALSCIFYWYYGLFTLGAALLLLIGHRWRSGKLTVRAKRLIWTTAVSGLVLLSPWAIWFFSGWSQIPGTSEVDIFPHPQAIQDAVEPGIPFLVGQGRHAGQAMPVSIWGLGLVGILLSIWAVVRRQESMIGLRHSIGLSAVAVLFWSLALGPAHELAPYNLAYGWAPPLRRFWWPVRHVIVANAAWGVLAALGLSSLIGRLPQGWKKFLSPGLALGVVLSAIPLLQIQGAPSKVQLMQVDLSASPLAPLADLENGVLLEPPISPEVAGTQQHLIYQLVHRKTLMSGHALWVDRVRPDDWDVYVAGNSWLSALQDMEAARLEGPLRFDAEDIKALDDAGLRWISLNREYFTFPMKELVDRYRTVFDALFGSPVFRDKGLWVYDIRNYTGVEEVELEDWSWPEDTGIGGEDLPMHGKRPKSEVFSDYP
jgi:hypothetical protein